MIQFSNNIILPNQEKKKENKVVKGIAAGLVTEKITKAGVQMFFSKPAVKEIQNISTNSKTLNQQFKAAAEYAFESSNLSKKGVEYIDGKNIRFDDFWEGIKNYGSTLDKKLIGKFKIYEKLNKKIISNQYELMKNGLNAFFIPKMNKIYINKENASIFAFHEMGHAINKHSKNIGAFLQEIRTPFNKLAGVALLVSIVKHKKQPEEQTGIIDRGTSFIKNNCGKLAFIGMLPTVLEEGLASINGQKLAKNILSENGLRRLNKMHVKAWLSYVGLAIGTTLGTVLASKASDKIHEENKNRT
jgi:hypothetical protein